MDQFLTLAVGNLASPMVLFFVLGVGAALLRSDLEIPQAIARALAIYLMLAIGFKGGGRCRRTRDRLEVGADAAGECAA